MKGYLHTQDRKILDGDEKEIILKGWGIGNWLLPEGYMWLGESPRFDRPRRIEQVLEELAGKEYMSKFWKKYHEDYFTCEDIKYMSDLGYNSVRIPFNWRILMEEGPDVKFKEEGFLLLDNCIEWCKKCGLYVFLDLHGAPGGQTGTGIDDCIDDVPRLFTDEDSWDKAIALWRELAIRYAKCEVVGGYDLLNEPIAPAYPGHNDFDYLVPKLIQFYNEVIKTIREVDQVHILSIEGIHWAADVSIFNQIKDSNMVLHFHRYAELPERKILDAFIDKSKELNIPLWMGETGENLNEWYTALYPLAASMGIGYNLWPWKKMKCTNSPCSINKPQDYDMILEYVKGGKHPGWKKAQEILDEYLKNIRLSNCELHPEITNYVFRKPPFSMRATDFDELPGKGSSYSGISEENDKIDYRTGCGMRIIEKHPYNNRGFYFDVCADRFALVLKEKEFVTYSVSGGNKVEVSIAIKVLRPGILAIGLKKYAMSDVYVKMGMSQVDTVVDMPDIKEGIIEIAVKEGEVEIEKISIDFAER